MESIAINPHPISRKLTKSWLVTINRISHAMSNVQHDPKLFEDRRASLTSSRRGRRNRTLRTISRSALPPSLGGLTFQHNFRRCCRRWSRLLLFLVPPQTASLPPSRRRRSRRASGWLLGRRSQRRRRRSSVRPSEVRLFRSTQDKVPALTEG